MELLGPMITLILCVPMHVCMHVCVCVGGCLCMCVCPEFDDFLNCSPPLSYFIFHFFFFFEMKSLTALDLAGWLAHKLQGSSCLPPRAYRGTLPCQFIYTFFFVGITKQFASFYITTRRCLLYQILNNYWLLCMQRSVHCGVCMEVKSKSGKPVLSFVFPKF